MFGKEECVPCLVLLSVWAKPWEPLCLLDFLQEVNTLCLLAHFAFLHSDLELQYLGNKWWVPQPIFLNIQMMSQQLLVWFGDVDGWPHEGHDTESPFASPSPPPSHLAFDILQLSAIRSQCLELPTGCRIWFMDATITPTAPMHRCLFQIFFSIMLQFFWK